MRPLKTYPEFCKRPNAVSPIEEVWGKQLPFCGCLCNEAVFLLRVVIGKVQAVIEFHKPGSNSYNIFGFEQYVKKQVAVGSVVLMLFNAVYLQSQHIFKVFKESLLLLQHLLQGIEIIIFKALNN